MKDFNDIKDYIIRTFLKDAELHECKKKAIKKLLKQYEIAMIEALEDEDFKQWHKDFILTGLIRNTEKIIKFDDLEVLANLTYFADFEHEANYIFYGEFIDLYFKLKAFKDSGIDESNYAKEIKSLIKKRDELQKFSKNIIDLDKIPDHPADTILEFININYGEDGEGGEWICYKENALTIINSIVSLVGIRFKGEYKTKPHKTSIAKRKAIELKEFEKWVVKMVKKELTEEELNEGKKKFAKYGEFDYQIAKAFIKS